MKLPRCFRIFGLPAGALAKAGLLFLMIGCAHSTRLVEAQTPSKGIAIGSLPESQAALDKELVADFTRRAAAYMKLHNKLEKQGTRQKQRDDIGENLVSRQALVMRLRLSRHDARPGDLFTPPIAMALRRAIDPKLRGVATRAARNSIREDAPEIFVLAVNSDYPDGAPRSTMPIGVLRILPTLPEGLEYRIVDTHLLLMDTEANLIVDYVLDVMCGKC